MVNLNFFDILRPNTLFEFCSILIFIISLKRLLIHSFKIWVHGGIDPLTPPPSQSAREYSIYLLNHGATQIHTNSCIPPPSQHHVKNVFISLEIISTSLIQVCQKCMVQGVSKCMQPLSTFHCTLLVFTFILKHPAEIC